MRRRDRHGRGLRGPLAPIGSPLHRSRAERFDDLVLQAVAQLEPRWDSQLAGVEFAVEEVPASDAPPASMPADE
ncbi:MAG TPA: peptidase, partial [Streptosporangiaceae bacterium]